ncbi:hypothetical protein LRY65_00110 [Candidatus Woesebacteria bacterium]|nr:hypothetical protein [Candidatus Woesebacteria bacterium]MCD8507255.1 hypothetical protein [Candidatus Woesebacteria bacterium]MCD8526609.1 hypothetical protein [Candidatus Woesebacteria bacterium]MCD8546005.1 hypothetical protein [Candidatus Woesebacteria bacterium]
MAMENVDIEKKANEWWLQRRQLVIAVGLFLGAGLLLAVGAYQFWQIASQVQISITQKEEELSKAEQRATLLNTISPDDRTGYVLVEQALPRFKEPLQVLRTLEAISQETQVALGEYDLNPGVVSTESAQQSGSSRSRSSGSRTQSLIIEIEVTGSFSQITNAINSIEESLPLMEITDMRIAPSRRGSIGDLAGVQYTATLQLVSYYADIPAQVARGGAQQISPSERRARGEIQEMEYWLEGASGASSQQDSTGSGNTDIFQLN